MSKFITKGLKTFDDFPKLEFGIFEYSTNTNRMEKIFEAKKLRKIKALNKEGIYIDPQLI